MPGKPLSALAYELEIAYEEALEEIDLDASLLFSLEVADVDASYISTLSDVAAESAADVEYAAVTTGAITSTDSVTPSVGINDLDSTSPFDYIKGSSNLSDVAAKDGVVEKASIINMGENTDLNPETLSTTVAQAPITELHSYIIPWVDLPNAGGQGQAVVTTTGVVPISVDPLSWVPVLTPDEELQLNIAIQQAVGPDNPSPLNIGQPENISDILSAANLLSLPVSTPSYLQSSNDSSPGAISQILSGTYADSVIQNQLSNQGVTPGSFVSPGIPYDYLFNPNATSLVDAMLLATHSSNTKWLDAQALEYGASSAPVIGAISTWMRPDSGWLSKGLSLAGALPIVSGLGGTLAEMGSVAEFGSLSAETNELGSLSTEMDTALGVEVEEEIDQHHIFPQALRKIFAEYGIDIDQWGLNLPKGVHDQLHSTEGLVAFGRGGLWNENWLQFFADPQFATTPPTLEQIREQAFRMVVGFDLTEYLPVVPYVKSSWW